MSLRRTGTAERLGWTAVVVLLLFAVAHTLVRGPVDVKGNFNLVDFANHYSSARVWLIGGNPYDNAALPIVWQASGPGAVHTSLDQWWSLLPPSAFVVMSPIGAMPAGLALVTWVLIGAISIAASIAAVLSIANIRASSLTGWLLIAGALAAAPFQTLFAVGQVSLPAIALLLVGIWCAQRGRDASAGILLGLAASLKPQLAAPFGLFYLVYRNWKLVGFASVTGMALLVIGIAQFERVGINWLADWTTNIAASTRPGEANDPTRGAPLRHHIINLSVLLYSFISGTGVVRAINLALFAALAGAYAWLARRGRLSADSLLSLALFSALMLLPVYHRSYDAAVLALAYAWALTSLRGPMRGAAWATIAALSVFLVPFDFLVLLQQKLGLFRDASQTWAWQALLAPHHAWATLAVCACLTAALYLKVRQLAVVYDTDEQPDVIPLHAHQRAWDTAARWRTARGAAGEPRPARRTG